MNRAPVAVVIGANGAGNTTWVRRSRRRFRPTFYNADSIAEGKLSVIQVNALGQVVF